MTLDRSTAQFRRWLHQAADKVADLYENLDQHNVMQATDPKELADSFAAPLPKRGSDPAQLIDAVVQDVFSSATLSIKPEFMAYIQSGGTQIGVIAELLSAALNQNACKWHLSPPGAELEKLTIRWIAELIGYPSDVGGALTSGGSAANLHCLAAARRVMSDWDVSEKGLSDHSPLTAYVSTQGHHSLDKSLDMLGIGRSRLRKIPITQNMTIDIPMLEARIRNDKARGFQPFCIIGNAGTTNTGAVDPMNDLADLADRYHLWFHVDAAYGGPAAALADKAHLFSGMTRAHSIAVDPHKWLFVPIEAGCALVRNAVHLPQTFSLLPDYLKGDVREDRLDMFTHNFQLSRNFKALKIYLTIKAYGVDRIKAAIAGNIETTDYLADLITNDPQFEILAPQPLSVLCFRYTHGPATIDEKRLNQMNLQLLDAVEQDGRIFLTGTTLAGKQALRICLVNHRTDKHHMDKLLNVLRELGKQVAENLSPMQETTTGAPPSH